MTAPKSTLTVEQVLPVYGTHGMVEALYVVGIDHDPADVVAAVIAYIYAFGPPGLARSALLGLRPQMVQAFSHPDGRKILVVAVPPQPGWWM